jgi:sigma-B regulation protein RsbU (phosphoserine phosphatase)
LRRPGGEVEVVPVHNGRLLGYPGVAPALSDTRFNLQPGATLILYTDGFTEAQSPDGQTLFGVEQLSKTLGGERTGLTLEKCGEELRAAVERFTGTSELQDDVTLFLLRHQPRTEKPRDQG